MALVILLHGDERSPVWQLPWHYYRYASAEITSVHTSTLIDVYLSSLHNTERQEWVVIVCVSWLEYELKHYFQFVSSCNLKIKTSTYSSVLNMVTLKHQHLITNLFVRNQKLQRALVLWVQSQHPPVLKPCKKTSWSRARRWLHHLIHCNHTSSTHTPNRSGFRELQMLHLTVAAG